MSESCLHCRIHDVIQAHARETYRPRPDGRQPIDAPAVTKALGAVVADVIAGGLDGEAIASGFQAFMAALTHNLRRHGVDATMSVDESSAEASGVTLQ